RVYSVEEMVDMLVALLRIRPPKGLSTCAVGHGGGASVMATDELERAGLRLAPIPPEIREKLKEFIDLANSMLRNPIDAGPIAGVDGMDLMLSMGNRPPVEFLRERVTGGPTKLWGRLNAALSEWPGLDLVVYHHGMDVGPVAPDRLRVGGSASLVFACKACDLPHARVFHSMGHDLSWQASSELRQLCAEWGLPIFLSMRGAAAALRRLFDYSQAYPDRLSGLHAPQTA
ncbi:MAG: hypothetical protein NTU41_15355, partial [Chloroflexi bacterium]|nr:hypothetical protein [Chloroflexota bacterium]